MPGSRVLCNTDRHEVTSAWSVANAAIGSPSRVSIVFTYSRHNTACRLRPALRQKKIAERGTPSGVRVSGTFLHKVRQGGDDIEFYVVAFADLGDGRGPLRPADRPS